MEINVRRMFSIGGKSRFSRLNFHDSSCSSCSAIIRLMIKQKMKSGSSVNGERGKGTDRALSIPLAPPHSTVVIYMTSHVMP